MTSSYVELRSKETARHVDLLEVRRLIAEAVPDRGWILVTDPDVHRADEALPRAYSRKEWNARKVACVFAKLEWRFAEGRWADDVRAQLGIDPFDAAITEKRAAHELTCLMHAMVSVAEQTATHWRLNYCGGWVGIIAPASIDASVAQWVGLWEAGSMKDTPPQWKPGARDHHDDPWPEPEIYPACLEEELMPERPYCIELLAHGPRREDVMRALRAAGFALPAVMAALRSPPAVIWRGVATLRQVEDEAERWARLGADVRVIPGEPHSEDHLS